MENRRKHERLAASPPFLVWDRETKELLGCLGNITPEGMMLIGGRSLKVGNVYQCMTRLPEERQWRKEIFFEAQVLWSHGPSDVKFYQTGFHLVNIAPEDLDILQQAIRAHDLSERLGQRPSLPKL